MITLIRRRIIGEHEIPYERQYLTFEALEQGTFQFTNDVDYSLDGKTWTTLAASTDSPTLNTGDTIRWRATLVPNSTNGIGTFSSTGTYNAYGNPLSLRLGNSFIGVTALPNNQYMFKYLFMNSIYLIDASNVTLIFTTIRNYCYESMFSGCTSLTGAPDLPFTGNLLAGCYRAMFMNCTSLVNAPYIAAESCVGNNDAASSLGHMFRNCSSLVNIERIPEAKPGTTYNYFYMFSGCSSLVSIPSLTINLNSSGCSYMFDGCISLISAANITFVGSILPYRVCYHMFYGCVSLTTPPVSMAANTCSGSGVCLGMFEGCTSLTTPMLMRVTTVTDSCFYAMYKDCTSLLLSPELPATTLAANCYRDMFYDCTSLTTAPDLPATTLANTCYYQMFYSCTNLVNIPTVLPAQTLPTLCYQYMFQNCSSIVQAPEILATQIATGSRNHCDHMFADCASLEQPPSKLSIVSTNGTNVFYVYGYMFQNCSKLKSTPDMTAMETAGDYVCRYMFAGCTSLTQATELPATTLGNSCYQSMFSNCTNLVSGPSILPAPTLTDNCYSAMFSGCTNLEVAPELPALQLANASYAYLFRYCSKINYVKALFITAYASSRTLNWLQNVSSTGTFVKNVDQTTLPRNMSGIPSGWTVEEITL